MRSRIAYALMAAVATAALVAGCDAPTAPNAARRPSQRHLTQWDPPIEVGVVQRTTPLAAPISATASIGVHGGRIAIPEAGFLIYFPQHSLPTAHPVQITVTALPGTNVAYRFEPEGLVFRSDPIVVQDLVKTSVFGNLASRDVMEGAYFHEPELGSGGMALVRETRPTFNDVRGWKSYWSVHHFSGYLLSSGRTGGYIGSSGVVSY